MAVTRWPFVAAVLLLVSRGLQCSPPLPACPVSCFCQQAPLLNCSSSGLSLAPQHIQATVTELDLSHNLLTSVTLRRPHQNLRNVWLGNNSITHLSFCMGRTMGTQYVKSGHPQYWRPWSRRGCVSWAPALQLLSVERNQLLQLPEGLGGSKSLRVLQLSYNKISTLQPEDLRHLRQLKELHLQHNLITSLHSQALGDLAQLRVLDLSFNLLTTLHPLTYLSLRNIGPEVRLSGNKWQCDCSMQSLRRWMDYDSNRGQQAWIIVCASPSTLSGRDLLQLEEDDLICFNGENRTGIHQDVTVDRGTEILLPCSTQQDSTWWMPNGQMSVSQSQAGLLISDITERDAGLYVCVSKSHQEIVSFFNLQIRKIEETKRKTRSPRSSQLIIPQGIPHRMGQGRMQNTTQADLTLAVCLSVFITFLVAFILGVLARPLIDVLWRRIRNKKSSSPTPSVSSAEQRPYDNEAYSSGEESVEIGTPRERRVTFSTGDFRGPSNVPYYDAVASDNHQSEKDKHMAGDSGSDSNSKQASPEDNQRGDRSGVTDPGPTHSMEFEHIPDPGELEESRSLSSHSSTSLSDKEQKEEQMTQRTPQLVEDPFQQRSKSPTVRPEEVPQISIDGRSEIPGFSSEPFADWSPHINGANLIEPDLSYESGENFEFTDSIQSASARSSSLFGSFNNSNQIVFPPSDNWKRSDGSRSSSSSSSNVSVNEPTQYTVNTDTEEGEDVEMIQNGQLTRDTKREIASTYLKQDVSFEQQIHDEDPIRPSLQGEGFNQGDYRHDTQRPPMGPEHSDSSHSSDSDEEPTQYTVNQETDENEEREGKVSKFEKSVSSMTTVERDRAEEVSPMPGADLEPEAKWSGPSLSVPLISKHLDTRAPSPPAAYSSSSRSDSEAEMTDHKKAQNKDRMEVGTTSHEPETRWPHLDLQSIPQIKRRLDIKAPTPQTDSCFSSESVDETTDHIMKQQQGEVDIKGLPFKESPIVSHEPETRWPDLDLGRITCIKRRLDIRAPSPPAAYSSSSRSDSEAEMTDHKKAQNKDRMEVGITSHESETRWPHLDLQSIPQIKRRLDIKAPTPQTDSCFSSESVDETTDHIMKQQQGEVDIEGLPFEESPIVSHEPETRWPDLDLGRITCIKRRLDIKAPSPTPDSSSSSSESEDGTTDTTVKLEGDRTDVGITNHEPETKWGVPFIKRRLDIKAPSQPDDSRSSCSDSENEMTNYTVKQERDRADVKITSHMPETKLPDLSLDFPHIKRRLDIKAPSPQPGSVLSSVPPDPLPAESHSSSSESENENRDHTTEKEFIRSPKGTLMNISLTPGRTHNIKLEKYAIISDELENKTTAESIRPAPNVNPDLESQWSGLNLGISRFRRRLDITSQDVPSKMPSLPPPESSSSRSDSEAEMTDHKKAQNKDRMEVGTTSHEPETRWPDLDLKSIPQIKRRLDIKAPSPQTDSCFSSESVDETTGHIMKQQQGEVDIEGLPFKESPIVSHEPETRWPDMDLGRINYIKRRLDIKAPSPTPDSSSSSSESEDGTTDTTVKLEGGRTDVGITNHEPEKKWGVPFIKRRLNIKAPSPQPGSVLSSVPPDPLPAESHSSSSESENENRDHTTEKEFIRSPKGTLMNISLTPGRTHNIKLEKYAIISDELENKTTAESIRPAPNVNPDLESQWSGLNLGISRFRRRLDITSQDVPPKMPSLPPPESSSSSSESGDESKRGRMTQKRGGVGIQGIMKKESVNVSLRSKNADNFNPNNSVEVKERLRKDNNFPTSEGKSDPEAMLARLRVPHIKRYLDINVTEEAPPTPPLPQPPDSSSSSDNENKSTGHAGKRWQLPDVIDKESPQSTVSLYPTRAVNINFDQPENRFEEAERKARLDLKSQMSKVEGELESKWPHLSRRNVPRLKRNLDIKAPSPSESKSSFSSKSKDETIDHTMQLERDSVDIKITSQERETKLPDLSSGVPRIKRYLNIKAPSPQPTDSSCSSSERTNEVMGHTAKQNRDGIDRSGITLKESQITSHKHVDIRVPSHPGDLSPSSSEDETADYTTQGGKKAEKLTAAQEDSPLSVGRIKASLAPRRVINISFDDVVKRRIEQARGTPAVDLPPELRWTGIGHLPDLPTSHPRRYLDAGSQPAQEAPPAVPGSPPPDTSSFSSERGYEMKPAPSRALNIMFDNSSSSTDELVWRNTSEDTGESKGLKGLKGLLSERQKWDTGHEEMERGSSPPRDDQGPSFQAATSFNYHSSEKDIKPLDKLSLPELLLSSTSMDNTRAGGSLHNFPRRRRRVVGGIQPSLEAPPPLPAEPLPEEEEAAGPTQRSPQSSEKQEWQSMTSYQQRKRAMEGFGRSSLSSISRGDEEERTACIGILGATPYHTARKYQSVSPTTTQTVSFDCEDSNMTSPSSSV